MHNYQTDALHKDSEDSYLASLSDLIIGVLFIFIILLMAFALNYSEAQIKVNQEKDDLREQNKQLSDASKERQELLENIQQALKHKGIPVEIDTRNGILRLPESLLFDSGKAEFRESGVAALEVVSLNLAEVLPCYVNGSDACKDSKTQKRKLEAIFIEGHTDNVPIHNFVFKDNWDLSVARAKGTYLALTKASSQLEQFKNERNEPLLSFSAYAERRPIVSNDSDEGRRKNRRIDLRFIMAVPKVATEPNSALK